MAEDRGNETCNPPVAGARSHPPGSRDQAGHRWIWAAAFIGVAAVLAWVTTAILGDRDGTQAVELGQVTHSSAAAGYNVVLVTLDTTRRDRLGCYGYEPARTPFIDSLMDHGVRFDDAAVTAPITLVSHTTILTGLYPYHHGVHDNGTYRLTEDHTTLAEILKAKGYSTAAFVGTFVLDKRFGLAQGFDVYDFEVSSSGWRDVTSTANEREADLVVNSAVSWLKRRSRDHAAGPFFMWVHFYDPHSPYTSPLYTTMAEERGRSIDVAYDAEIAFVDLHLGRLFHQLETEGLRDHTLIVLTADHGEMLGEHGEAEHGGFLYEAAMRAPLIFSCPALFDRPYRVDDRIVSTIDIVPTIADLLGVKLPVAMDGVSLLSAPSEPDRAVYMETFHTKFHLGCAPLFALRRHHDKFILAPRSEYYDLSSDPAEETNLYGGTLFQDRELEQRLVELVEGVSGAGAGARTMTPDEVERLAALGYVDFSGGASAAEEVDPKDRVPLLSELGQALALKQQGEYDRALEVALDVADRLPGVFAPVQAAAGLYAQLDRRDEAIRLLSDYCREHPSIEAYVQLAGQLLAAHRYEELERTLEDAARIEPGCGAVAMIRGHRYYQEGRYAEAIEQYRQALKIDPERVGPLVRDRLQDAVRHLNAQAP
jgi:choline-sulfatase